MQAILTPSWTIGPPGPPVFPHELCCLWQAKAVLHLHGDITEGRNPEAAKRLHLMGGVGQKKSRPWSPQILVI